MVWEDILPMLQRPVRGYPVAVVRSILDTPEHLERLLIEFERISQQPEEMASSTFPLYAMHLLAEKRETRAFQPLMRIAALPEDQLDDVLGDHLTESFNRCIAAVCNDESQIRRFIENRTHAEWARKVLLGALVQRVFAGDASGTELLEWLTLLGDKTKQWLEEQPESAYVYSEILLMTGLAGAIAAVGTPEHLPIVQRWYDAGVLDRKATGLDWYAKQLHSSRAERIDRLQSRKGIYVPDAIAEMQDWYCFSDRFHAPREPAKIISRNTPPPVSVVREQAKIGRNDPCPCGSGKKYKKCCGG